MTIFAHIYYSYLALINSCMHMHFLNRVRWLIFWDKFWIPEWLFFGTEGVLSNCNTNEYIWPVLVFALHPVICFYAAFSNYYIKALLICLILFRDVCVQLLTSTFCPWKFGASKDSCVYYYISCQNPSISWTLIISLLCYILILKLSAQI